MDALPVRLPRTIGGIAIPDTDLCRKAARLARAVCPPVVYNHVLRTFVFGALVAGRQRLRFDAELFFLGAALHDLGLAEAHHGGARFEVAGADAADAFLAREGLAPEKREIVWDAIALHTSVGIADRKRPEIALVHIGAGVDVLGLALDDLPDRAIAETLEAYPRLDFKNSFLDVLHRTVLAAPRSHASTWFGDIVRANGHVHGCACPTFEEAVRAAPFAE